MASTSADSPKSAGSVDRMSQLLTATVHSLDNSDLVPSGYSAISADHSPTSSFRLALSPADGGLLRHENLTVKNKLRQCQAELQTEQDVVSSLRRKLNHLERDRLDAVSKANEEVSRLDSEVARLRAQLEKGEAVRQNLEFELAKARKEVTSERRNAGEREALMTDVNDSLKNKISELSQQVEQLCQELETTRGNSDLETERLRQTCSEKDAELSHARTDQDMLEAEKDRLEAALQQQERTVMELDNRVKELEAEKRHLSDSLHLQVSDTELAREKESRTRKDLEMVLLRMKNLEESIENERAAHLESKFNSEIVQLRIRDLEGALVVEKTAKSDSMSHAENLAKQLSDLQQNYETERKSTQQSHDKLEKAEKESALLNKQLANELEEKKNLIKKLSGQIDLHQQNFDQLKDELGKAKKRQVYLEETYGGSMRELELLLNNFQVEPMNQSPAKKKTKKSGGDKMVAPSVVLGSLRHTLTEYKRRLEHSDRELSNIKVMHDKLAKECSSCKDKIFSKDKTLETTQQSMTKASRDLKKARQEVAELEHQVAQLSAELTSLSNAVEFGHTQNIELNEQIVKVSTKYKHDDQVRTEFLHSLYQQLLTGRLIARPLDGSINRLAWSDLTSLISEQVALLINSLHHAEEKVLQVEKSSRVREDELTQLQHVHEEQLNKLAAIAKDSSSTWHQQKAEMESHYSALLAEIHARHKKTQSLADQAWEKVRATGTVQQGLEAECSELRRLLEKTEHEHKVLLTTCALMIGAFYPMCSRVSVLAAQRNVLMEQCSQMDSFKNQVHYLMEALEEDGTPVKEKQQKAHLPPLLRFRCAVVAILAANRLMHQTRGHCHMLSVPDALPGLHTTVICTGGIEAKSRQFSGVSKAIHKPRKCLGEIHSPNWLRSNDLLTTILATVADVGHALQKNKDQSSSADRSALLGTTRSSFQKLMCHLPSMFPAVEINPHGALQDRNSLIRRLGQGLARAVANIKVPYAYRQPKGMVSQLQASVLGFTRRLHAAEVERRDLRVELSRLTQEKTAWSQNTHNVAHLMQEITILRRQVEGSQPGERFDSICQELNAALRREQQAKASLKQHEAQLADLTSRLDSQMAHDLEKQHGLSQATQGMTEARMELRQQEQLVRQLNRQLSLLEAEQKAQKEHLVDAENALRTAVKDKDSLATYMKSVGKALQQLHPPSSLLISGEIVDLSPLVSVACLPADIGKVSPELAACQLLTSSFLDVLKALNSWFFTLKEEISSHKQHISSLKHELSVACHRELDEEVDPVSGNFAQIVGSSPPTRLQHDTFSPLKEDDSYVAPTPANKKSSKAQLIMTPQRERSSGYKTPQSSRRASSLNRRQRDSSASKR